VQSHTVIIRAVDPVISIVVEPIVTKLRLADGKGPASWVLTVQKIVSVVINAVTAVLRTRALRCWGALGIGTVRMPITVVVDPVGTQLSHRAGDIQAALVIGTVDQAVDVVVHPIGAELDNAGGSRKALSVQAVDIPVAIVIEAVVAELVDAVRGTITARIHAIHEAVRIVIETIGAEFGETGGISNTVGIVAVQQTIPVVIEDVVADFSVAGDTQRTLGIITVRKAIAVVVDLVVTILYGRTLGCLQTLVVFAIEVTISIVVNEVAAILVATDDHAEAIEVITINIPVPVVVELVIAVLVEDRILTRIPDATKLYSKLVVTIRTVPVQGSLSDVGAALAWLEPEHQHLAAVRWNRHRSKKTSRKGNVLGHRYRIDDQVVGSARRDRRAALRKLTDGNNSEVEDEGIQRARGLAI